MKSNHLLLISLILLLSSCQQKTQTNSLDDTVFIDLTKFAEPQGPAEEWIEEIQFIPLETKPECFLSSRIRYNLNSDNIVVASDQTVHLFQKDGQHMKSFKKLGKGPGEYGMIYDINLVPGQKEIMIVAPNLHKVLFYDFSGNLNNEIRTPFMPIQVVPISKELFACYRGRLNTQDEENPSLNQIIFLNRQGKIISTHLPFKYLMNGTNPASFSNSGENGVYFINPSYEFNIYQVGTGNQFLKKYHFDIGVSGMDTSLINNERIMLSKNPREHFGDKQFKLDYLTISSNTISFWGPIIRSEIKFGTRQINRKSGNVRFMEIDTLSNFGYYEGIPIAFETPPKSFGEYFVYRIEAIDMIEILYKLSPEQKKILSKSKGFNKLATLKEEDNPVLILYKVKDF